MRVIIFINTYFQLITAMQMKNTLLKEDFVTAVITDRSNNASAVADRLAHEEYFDETVFCEAKYSVQNRTWKQKSREFFDIVFRKTNRYKFYLNDLRSGIYDLMIFYNYDIDMYGVYSMLSYINDKISVALFEEGILSYDNILYDSVKFKILRMLRNIVNKRNIIDNIIGFYCFYPELNKSTMKSIRIPQISENDTYIKDVLLRIFNIKELQLYRKYKYIFFESSYETDGYDIEESKVFLKLARLLGENDVLIKKHPRSNTHVYEESGIAVDENSSVPFEVIQLSTDMSNIVFVSTISESTISANAIVKNKSSIIFVYPLTNYMKNKNLQSYIHKSQIVIDKLIDNGNLNKVKILHDYDEL